MEVVEVLHMNGGIGDFSYSNNSLLQSKVISMTMPIAKQAITKLYSTTPPPTTFTIADLGCSSGPNTLMAVSHLIKHIETLRRILRNNNDPIEYQVFLNDLPGNDFNTIFKSLPSFLETFNDFGPCFFCGVPGSFYGRLFPSKSVHFVHSSYSLMWLSRVPKGLEENKRSIYISKLSPRSVVRAYYEQFENDFSLFLKCRGEELVDGGFMVLTLLGRGTQDPAWFGSCYIWELLAVALNQMVSQGMIEEEKLESFHIPQYMPSPTEIKYEVAKQGSFVVDHIQVSKIHWDVYSNQYFNTPSSNASINNNNNNNNNHNHNNHNNHNNNNNNNNGHKVAKYMRAVAEPMLISHFGEQIIDELFIRYGDIIADRMTKQKTEFFNVTVSLTKPKPNVIA